MSRQTILDAAARIFSEKGYHATSMNDIANAVNLQKASIYYHVASKQEILLLILDEALDLVISRVSEVISKETAIKDKLRSAVQIYLTILTEQPNLASVLLLEHKSLKPEFHDRHVPRRDKFEQLWRDLLQKGTDEGTFNIKDVNLTTRALLGLMNWVVTWYKAEGALSVIEIADQYTDLILEGILLR
jgi:AcrR family transcriptional regulator